MKTTKAFIKIKIRLINYRFVISQKYKKSIKNENMISKINNATN